MKSCRYDEVGRHRPSLCCQESPLRDRGEVVVVVALQTGSSPGHCSAGWLPVAKMSSGHLGNTTRAPGSQARYRLCCRSPFQHRTQSGNQAHSAWLQDAWFRTQLKEGSQAHHILRLPKTWLSDDATRTVNHQLPFQRQAPTVRGARVAHSSSFSRPTRTTENCRSPFAPHGSDNPHHHSRFMH